MQNNSFKSLVEFLSPTKTESILYALAGILLIITAKAANTLDSFTASAGIGGDINHYTMIITDKFAEYSNISGAFFWFLAGAILYLIIWVSVVILIDWYNDVLVSTSFMHPRSFHQSEYWVAIVGRFLIRVAAGFLLATLSVIIIGTFIPAGFSYAHDSWSGGNVLSAILNFFVILVISFVCLHSTTLLLRLVFLRRRLYS